MPYKGVLIDTYFGQSNYLAQISYCITKTEEARFRVSQHFI